MDENMTPTTLDKALDAYASATWALQLSTYMAESGAPDGFGTDVPWTAFWITSSRIWAKVQVFYQEKAIEAIQKDLGAY